MKKLFKNCIICGKRFEKTNNCSNASWFGNKKRPNGVKFCSKQCSDKYKIGKIFQTRTLFSKERHFIPKTAFKKGEHRSLETEFKKGQFSNEKHPFWKGDDVGMVALHSWVKRRLGFPMQCEFCEKIVLNRKSIHWANKSGEYKRDLNDWLRLCVPCHKKYDLNRLK